MRRMIQSIKKHRPEQVSCRVCNPKIHSRSMQYQKIRVGLHLQPNLKRLTLGFFAAAFGFALGLAKCGPVRPLKDQTKMPPRSSVFKP